MNTPETDAMASMRRTTKEWREHSERLEIRLNDEKMHNHGAEYVRADDVRIALGGHRCSVLFGDTGLIAATMRCVKATEKLEEDNPPRLNRPCISWNQSNGPWSIREDSDDGLSISNSIRGIGLGDLSDDDLATLQRLIATAIGCRETYGPNVEAMRSADNETPTKPENE